MPGETWGTEAIMKLMVLCLARCYMFLATNGRGLIQSFIHHSELYLCPGSDLGMVGGGESIAMSKRDRNPSPTELPF